MINNYDKMQGVQQSLDTISKSVSNKEGDKVMETGGEVIEEEKEQEGDKILEEPENPEAQILEDDIYVVEKGDTLATISRKVYGDISHVEAICKMNGWRMEISSLSDKSCCYHSKMCYTIDVA